MRKEITKEDLIKRQVEVRRENGVDVVYQYRLKQQDYIKLELRDQTSKHKYKDQEPYKYVNLALYDEEKIYKYNSWSYKYGLFAVHRIVYAWYNGYCPEEFDVDHIDNNHNNNNIENLQLLDRKHNNDRKLISRNQYTYNLTDAEILAKRKEKKTIYDRETQKAIRNPENEENKQISIRKRQARHKKLRINFLTSRINETMLLREMERQLIRASKYQHDKEDWHKHLEEYKKLDEKLKALKAERKALIETK